ncbi:vWA domain-containing protein [Actinomyces vulturis]|uniref:vWA domain-containing protein n=1 Tax=Actinomyces vulturis TaxID=1857645 RepID=UPI00082DD1F8|nr:VWA domain-containing protein [Actinomyces vulturis]
MMYPWILVLVALAISVTTLVVLLSHKTSVSSSHLDRRRVAHTRDLLASLQVKTVVRRRRVVMAVLSLMAALSVMMAGVIAARPVKISTASTALSSRDIVLCMDVSTSMIAIDEKVLGAYRSLLDSFHGERVALVVWNSTAQTVVPLTDDYDLLRKELGTIEDALSFDPYRATYQDKINYDKTFAGTLDSSVYGSSLAGDGLAACTMLFDHQATDRSRSIILSTDNVVMDPYDVQLVSLEAAADEASKRDIRLYALYGYDPASADDAGGPDGLQRAKDELLEVIRSHDGMFYNLEDPDVAHTIVDDVNADQAEELGVDEESIRDDDPTSAVVLLALSVAVLLGLGAVIRS